MAHGIMQYAYIYIWYPEVLHIFINFNVPLYIVGHYRLMADQYPSIKIIPVENAE